MLPSPTFKLALAAVFVLSPVVFVLLLRIPAPYGRHARAGFGPTLPTRRAWVLMELPAAAGFALFAGLGPRTLAPTPVVLLLLWQAHYLERALVYPLRMRTRADRGTPLLIVLLGAGYNVVNTYLNGAWVASATAGYEPSWLVDPRFVVGVALFVTGYAINRWADAHLRHLRQEADYAVPHRGPFRYVSCPNYAGEILEWIGWAVATWSLAGLSFAVFTAANLIPRALAHHRWYRERFADYPRERRAVVPFLL